MRLLAPTLAVEHDRAVVGACVESERGRFGPIDVHLWVPRRLIGAIDSSATPFIPIAAVAAAAAGEDLTSEGAASAAVVRGAVANTATMAGWWSADGWRAPTIDAPPASPAHPDPARGHGLCFSLGVDSWASLLALAPAADGAGRAPLTHLIRLVGTDRPRSAEADVRIGGRVAGVAADFGLDVVEVGTDGRDLLDPLDVWDRTHGAVLAAAALLLRPLLAQVTVAGSHSDHDRPTWGSHPDLDGRWAAEDLRIDHHLGGARRIDKVAAVATQPRALADLLVCWEGGESANCGRCAKCLRTMTALELVGALEATSTFPDRVDPALVRAARADGDGFVRELLERLPAGELRAAWRTHLPPRQGWRVVHGTDPALAGPSLAARVDAALEPTGWTVLTADRRGTTVGTASSSDGLPAAALVVGWEAGMVPLRPSTDRWAQVIATAATQDQRPLTWVMADLADPERRNEPGPATVADAAERAWGPGACYLAGLGWGPTGAVLDPAAVGRLLDVARVRVWWEGGDRFDPIRLVEAIEHGCAPIQVMAPAMATNLRRRLPAPLATCVIGLHELATVDTSPAGTGARLCGVIDVVVHGSVERELALDAAFPTAAARG